MNARILVLPIAFLVGCGSTPKAKTAMAPKIEASRPTGADASLFMATDGQGNGSGGANGRSRSESGMTTAGGLFLSEELMRVCGLEATKSAPKFDFDSAGIAPEDRPVLQKLVTCLNEGALKGRTVSLVGHTDQLGEAEYNMALGEMRADAVRRYLHDLGVGEERLTSSSRGELDAVGEGEEGRSFDRRVDISLPGTR